MGQYDALLAGLLRDEEELCFDAFSHEMALDLGTRLVAAAKEAGLTVTVDVSRPAQQLFHCAMAGTTGDNDEWIRRKNRVVLRFEHSSYYMGTYLRSQGTTIEEKYLLDGRKYGAHGGAFPIIVQGAGVVGTVTVSGLPEAEDHALVVRVLHAYLGLGDRTSG